MNEIQSTLDDISRIRNDAQDVRKSARAYLEKGDDANAQRYFQSAAEKFQEAIVRLRGELRTLRQKAQENSAETCSLLESLSQTYGAQGGTYRDARDYQRAIDFYDQGYKIELERIAQCQHKDSYNLLQRLVTRILLAPDVLSQERGKLVRDVDVATALEDARGQIERQVFSGRDDSWALADLALVRFLCGQDAEQAIRDLEGRKSDALFYESTLVVVKALIKEGLGGTGVGDRLERFGRLLWRKGGMK